MSRKQTILCLVLLALAFTCTPQLFAATMGTAFTYQGRLADGGSPAQGFYDLRFALYSSDSGGSPMGSGPLTNTAVAVSSGLFSVVLDFGSSFGGSPRWLEVGVRTNAGTTFTTLTPRQPLTPAPYAIYASNAGAAASAASATAATNLALYGHTTNAGWVSWVDASTNQWTKCLATGKGFFADINGNLFDQDCVQLTRGSGGGVTNGQNVTFGTVTAARFVSLGDFVGPHLFPIYEEHVGTNLMVAGFGNGTNGQYWLVSSNYDEISGSLRVWTNAGMVLSETYADPYSPATALLSNSVLAVVVVDAGDMFPYDQYPRPLGRGTFVWTTNADTVGYEVVGTVTASSVVAAQATFSHSVTGSNVIGQFYGNGASVSNLVAGLYNAPVNSQLPITLWSWLEPTNRKLSTPTRGYGSWNDYQGAFGASQAMAIATNFTTYGLKAAGYTNLIIDNPWWMQASGETPIRDANHKQQVNATLFPSGMSSVVATLHSLGFSVGLYAFQSTLQDYPEVDAETYCEYGIDYLDIDNAFLTVGTGHSIEWLDRFAATMHARCVSNSRPDIVIFGHCWGGSASFSGGVLAAETDASIHKWLDIRRDWDDPGFITADYFNGVMADGRWYDRAIPKAGVHLNRGNWALMVTNDLYRVHLQMAASVLMSGDLTIDAGFSAATLSNFTGSVAYQMLPVVTNTIALEIHADSAMAMPVQVILRPDPLAYAWVKPLGSTKTPTQWAVAVVNDQSSNVTNNITFHTYSLPGVGGLLNVTDVWARASWTCTDELIVTNLAPGDVKLFKLSPHSY